jgi:hypothetical protein
MEAISVLASTVAGLIITEAAKKIGGEVGQHSPSVFGKLINRIRMKFSAEKVEGVLDSALRDDSESNQEIFKLTLESQLSKDKSFANEIENLLRKLESSQINSQEALTEIEVDEDIQTKDIRQVSTGKGFGQQKAVSNIKARNIDIGNLTQEN